MAILMQEERIEYLTKREYIDYTAALSGLTKGNLTLALDAFMDSAVAAIEEGESIELMGFGKLAIKHKAARFARDPRTGERLYVAPRKGIKFIPGSRLRRAVGEDDDE